MKIAIIRSSWLKGYGYRLDTRPYVGGALQTKILLEELPNRTDPLHTLTRGHDDGIFNGPHFSRTYVEDPDYGVPFLGGAALQFADLSNLPLLSSKLARSKKLKILEIKRGMTLITCAGTIGKMAYARPDMEGIWTSQHIMKVVPDETKILPGYLYAFLSSKFGVPLVTSGTYGSIIQSIEPEHLSKKIDVPRLDPAEEQEVHDLVEESGVLVTEHIQKLKEATSLFFSSVGLEDTSYIDWQNKRDNDLGFSVSSLEAHSFRPMNYAKRLEVLHAKIKARNWLALGDLCVPGTLIRGGRFNRVECDVDQGHILIGQRDLFSLRPGGKYVATTSVPDDAFLNFGCIAVAARGTLGEHELYCRSQFISNSWLNYVFSEDILRIYADEQIMLRGCLFAFLRSETGFRLLRGISSGTKLQEQHYWLLPRLPVPVPSNDDMCAINKLVLHAMVLRDSAIEKEHEAIGKLEKALEKER